MPDFKVEGTRHLGPRPGPGDGHADARNGPVLGRGLPRGDVGGVGGLVGELSPSPQAVSSNSAANVRSLDTRVFFGIW